MERAGDSRASSVGRKNLAGLRTSVSDSDQARALEEEIAVDADVASAPCLVASSKEMDNGKVHRQRRQFTTKITRVARRRFPSCPTSWLAVPESLTCFSFRAVRRPPGL